MSDDNNTDDDTPAADAVTCRAPAREYVSPTPGTPIETPLAWNLSVGCCPDFTTAYNAATDQAAKDILIAQFNQLRAAAIDLLFAQTCFRYNVSCDFVYPCVAKTCCGNDFEYCNSCDGCWRKALNLRNYVPDDILEIIDIEVATNGVIVTVPHDEYRLDGSQLVPFRTGTILYPHWPRQHRNELFGSGTPALGGFYQWRALVRHGKEPPPSLLLAAGDLACQLWNFCQNKPCDIPSNAVSVSREGVTIQLQTGLKAIPSVAMAIDTYGDCTKTKRRSRITSPSDWIIQ